MEEIWKPCPFAENTHMISNFGRVKKNGHFRKYRNWQGKIIDIWRNEFILKLNPNHRGYLLATINNDKLKAKAFQVHRLVAFAFIEGYEKNKQVNHIDGNNQNNIFTNLEWCKRI